MLTLLKMNRKVFFASFFLIFFAVSCNPAWATQILCTKSDNVNFRNGPGIKFSIIFKIFKKDYPVSVVETIDAWHAVVDFKGDKMWVSSINLVSKCGGIVKMNAKPEVKIKPQENALTLFALEEGFVLKDITCYKKWCKVKIENKTGWIEEQFVWGVSN